MTTPIFKDPWGQGLKQNIRCTTRPQTHHIAKRIISQSFIVSEELRAQDYIDFQDHAHFLRPWGSGAETKCQVHNQTTYQVECKKNQLSIYYSFRGVASTRIVYGRTDGRTDGRRTTGYRISSSGQRPVELKRGNFFLNSNQILL